MSQFNSQASFPLTICLIITLGGAQVSPQQIIRGDGTIRGGRQVAPIPSASEDSSGLSYRALGTNHYRNFYRNRNYFVRTDVDKPVQEHNTVIPALKEYKPSAVPQTTEGTSSQNQAKISEAPPSRPKQDAAAAPASPSPHHDFGHRESEVTARPIPNGKQSVAIVLFPSSSVP